MPPGATKFFTDSQYIILKILVKENECQTLKKNDTLHGICRLSRQREREKKKKFTRVARPCDSKLMC